MSDCRNLYSVLSFENDDCFLKRDLDFLTEFCKKACETEDPKLYRKAIKMLNKVEDKLWKYYMEVYLNA